MSQPAFGRMVLGTLAVHDRRVIAGPQHGDRHHGQTPRIRPSPRVPTRSDQTSRASRHRPHRLVARIEGQREVRGQARRPGGPAATVEPGTDLDGACGQERSTATPSRSPGRSISERTGAIGSGVGPFQSITARSGVGPSSALSFPVPRYCNADEVVRRWGVCLPSSAAS
jgi:hypothetical protein